MEVFVLRCFFQNDIYLSVLSGFCTFLLLKVSKAIILSSVQSFCMCSGKKMAKSKLVSLCQGKYLLGLKSTYLSLFLDISSCKQLDPEGQLTSLNQVSSANPLQRSIQVLQ